MRSHRTLSVMLTVVLLSLLLSCDRPPESPSSVLSSDGVPIHYEVHGSGEPALVFVHGWSCDRTVVEKLGLEEVVLVGHSMGGLVVAEAARLLGYRVKVVVGVDTFGDVSGRISDEQSLFSDPGVRCEMPHRHSRRVDRVISGYWGGDPDKRATQPSPKPGRILSE